MTSSDVASIRTRVCPDCGETLLIDERYVTWCEDCGWNLEPAQAQTTQQSARQVKQADRARERGEALFRELSAQPLQRPRMTAGRVASLAVAVLVHAITLAILVLGVYVLVSGIGHVSSIVLGLALILLSLLLRPHLGKLDRRSITITRREAPHLFKLTDSVANQLGADPVETIVIDPNFNAAHGRVGLRRRPVLWLGMPLWEILSDDQRVALLGHEFGHQVNGDLAYGLVVGSALRTLTDWYRLLQPRFRRRRTKTLFDLLELIGSAVAVGFLRSIGFGVGLLLHAEGSLVSRSSQQAEYYADSLSATIGSRDAAVECVDLLHLARPCTLAVHYAAKRREQDLWATERQFVESLPAKEWERFRRIDTARGTSIDSTHPPTSLRVALLRTDPARSPLIELTAEDSAAITRELEPARQAIATRLRDRATR